MRISRITLFGGGISALLLGALMVAPSALAQTPPNPVTGTTQGTAGGGTGNASVLNIGDLKAAPPSGGAPGALLCGGGGCNYDDDPAPNADNHFNVVPNLGDSPNVQWVNKYIFISNPTGVSQIQKTISALDTSGAAIRTVFDDLQAATDIVSGQACLTLLGADATTGSVANGLLTTGQKTAAELLAIRNGCQQNTVGVAVNPFPVSKHLPPGVYRQCVNLALTGGGAAPTSCVYFRILPITGFGTDANIVDYGSLVQNVKSIFAGNFTMDNNANNINPGTVVGLGNTSPKLLVAYSWMVNDYNNTPNDYTDDKIIHGVFDAQINRMDTGGNIVATQHVDNIAGGDIPTAANPFGPDADLTLGTSTGTLVPICLEPNENLKLDFSVTPGDVLWPGGYHGLYRLTVTNSGSPCTPTLGAGESASGDSGSLYDNLPGTAVLQAYP